MNINNILCNNLVNIKDNFLKLVKFLVLLKLGWQDLNLRMAESKSAALPLGDTPKC